MMGIAHSLPQAIHSQVSDSTLLSIQRVWSWSPHCGHGSSFMVTGWVSCVAPVAIRMCPCRTAAGEPHGWGRAGRCQSVGETVRDRLRTCGDGQVGRWRSIANPGAGVHSRHSGTCSGNPGRCGVCPSPDLIASAVAPPTVDASAFRRGSTAAQRQDDDQGCDRGESSTVGGEPSPDGQRDLDDAVDGRGGDGHA